MSGSPSSVRRPQVAILWIVLVVGTSYALAAHGRPYPWHLAAALALYVLLGYRIRPPGWSPLSVNARATLRVTSWACLIVVVGTALLVLVGIALVRGLDLRFELVPQNVRSPDQFWDWVILAVLWAPLVEEVTYRAWIHPHLRELLGRRAAILVNGLLFWILHWFYAGGVTLPNHLLGGLVFAWLYDRTRSLIAPMLIHALSNLMLGLGDLFWLHHRELVERWLDWT